MSGRNGPERRGPERPGPDYPPEWDNEPEEHDVEMCGGVHDGDGCDCPQPPADFHPIGSQPCCALPVEPPAEAQQDDAVCVCPRGWASHWPYCPLSRPASAEFERTKRIAAARHQAEADRLIPAEAQQDDCRHLTWDVDLTTGLACCARCGARWADTDEGRAALAARPSADTETLRQAWAGGYAAAQSDALNEPYSDRPERATWKPTANPYGDVE